MIITFPKGTNRSSKAYYNKLPYASLGLIFDYVTYFHSKLYLFTQPKMLSRLLYFSI